MTMMHGKASEDQEMFEILDAREKEKLTSQELDQENFSVEFHDDSGKSSRGNKCRCCRSTGCLLFRNICCCLVSMVTTSVVILVVYKIYLNQVFRRQSGANSKNGFRIASYYSSHMVLQRPPVRPRMWGYAHAVGDVIVVTLNSGEQIVTVSALDGPDETVTWEAILDPINTTGPHIVTAQSNAEGSETITLTNVLVGDVWLCSGQSNMDHDMRSIDNPSSDLRDAVNYPEVRTFYTGHEFSRSVLQDLRSVKRNWEEPTPENIAPYSAVCWLFGRDLYRKYRRPIGLIHSSWSGTRIESWSSPDALKKCFTDVQGQNPPNGPSELYNAMIYPFHPMPIYGAIWYQGEYNTHNAGSYGCALKAMVSDWRNRWIEKSPTMNSDFPFGVVQLAPWREREIATGFPDVRWAQTDGFGYLPNARMHNYFLAVAIDLPDFHSPYGDIHPRYKRQIASRLALAAYAVAYNSTDEGLYQGPIPVGFKMENKSLVKVSYDIPLQHRSEKPSFELCCGLTRTTTCTQGGRWEPSSLTLKGTQHVMLQVPCNTEEHVTGFRYLWRESPCKLEQCPLYSIENNLPAPPFLHNGEIT